METKTTSPSSNGLKIRSIIGGTIGLILTSTFLISAGKGDPTWPDLWFIRPLLVVTIATTISGAYTYIVERAFLKNGWNIAIAYIISLVVYMISLWLSFVVGFNGTYWH